MKQWDKAFKERGKIFLEPQENMLEMIKCFKKNGVRKILDLGSGTGRHIIQLAQEGFDVYGIDISEEGIKITRKWLKGEKLKADLKIGSMYARLPYKDNFFDAIISIQSFHHERIRNIRKGILEIKRILKPNGFIFMTFRKRKFGKVYPNGTIVEKYGKQKSRYKVIEARTYVPIEGEEKGLPHYLFNRQLIKKEFNNFKISEIWADKKGHYCFLGKLIK
ncbi:MAG TPA: class I SAM-dependent methyltransferase [Candidatus Moranbacteria bacterium]|nr:class I SAM-dependent methyltransferase [Candidatus Moranbacteria bacterium]HRY27731.1 class I SAM-dependent methyltransferase [Candidatus Moranbacteria bacterium]HSA08528.1 class I SAM-dependent methyltransferase [Candidatus Moranbacteria bacterium]